MVVGKYEDRGAQRERELERRAEEEHVRLSKGITSAIAQGEVPPTSLINEALEQAREGVSMARLNPTLTSDGRAVAGDLSNVISDVQQVLTEKNEGETLQKLAYHTREAGKEAQYMGSAAGSFAGSSTSAQKVGEDLKEVVSIATDLARLVAMSPEFRRLFQDLSVFLLEVLQVKLEHTREAIEQQIDEKKPLSQSLQDVAEQVAKKPISSEGESVTEKKDIDFKIDPQIEKQTQKQKEQGEFKSDWQVEQDRQRALEEGKTVEPESQRGGRAGKKGDIGEEDWLKEAGGEGKGKKGKQRQHEWEQKQHGKDEGAAGDKSEWERTRKQLHEESKEPFFRDTAGEPIVRDQLSEEDRRKLLARLRTWAKEIQKRRDFRQGIHDLFDALDDLRHHFMAAADEATAVLAAHDPTSHRVQAQQEAKRLLEQFAGGHSVEPTVQSLRQLVRSTKNDKKFEEYLDSLGDFFKRCVDDPDYVQSEQVSRDLDRKIDEGELVLKSHRVEFDEFFRNADDFVKALSNDRTISRLSEDTQKLVRHLFLDSEGRPTLKTGTLMDMRKILGPILRSQLAYIALPTLTFNDDSISWVMENVVLKGEDIVPDQVIVENYARAVIKPLSDEEDTAASLLRVRVTGMRAHVPNVHFAYKRKVFPRMEDVCSFDAHIGDSGINIQMVLKLSTSDTKHVFRVSEVRCDIESLVLKNIQGVEHSNALYTFLKPIIQNNARVNMEQSIVNSLFDWMWDLDQLLMQYRDQIAMS